MHLAFDIFQGLGIAVAVGIRPFLPALVVGALAAGDIQIDFAHTSYSFLEGDVFLFVMVVGVLALGVSERLVTRAMVSQRAMTAVLGVASLTLGALLFAGSLARGHYAAWPGLVGGVICAAIGLLAISPLLNRVRARLDAESARALPLFSEAAAVLGAALSVVAPPVGVVVLGLVLWLLWAGRGRGEQKYAGLRILR
ncbi:MAG: hypothetical protein ACYCXW_11185 [Solirubrobacteraceae bacterium]